MIPVTLWLCHCEQRLEHSICPSSIFALHPVILLKDFHQIQMFSSAAFHLWHQVALHQIGFYQLTVLFVMRGDAAQMYWGKNMSKNICQEMSVLGTKVSEPRWRAQGSSWFWILWGATPDKLNLHTPKSVVVLIPGTSTHILLFISRNCLQNLTYNFHTSI